jgi:hypothetical protein
VTNYVLFVIVHTHPSAYATHPMSIPAYGQHRLCSAEPNAWLLEPKASAENFQSCQLVAQTMAIQAHGQTSTWIAPYLASCAHRQPSLALWLAQTLPCSTLPLVRRASRMIGKTMGGVNIARTAHSHQGTWLDQNTVSPANDVSGRGQPSIWSG